MKRLLLTVGLISLVLSAAVFAQGKGKKKPDAALLSAEDFVLVLVDDANGDGVPSYADSIAFSVAGNVDWHQIQMACYQDGELVASAWRGYFYNPPILMQSRSWTGGAVQCVAELQQFGDSGMETLAVLEFAASAQ